MYVLGMFSAPIWRTEPCIHEGEYIKWTPTLKGMWDSREKNLVKKKNEAAVGRGEPRTEQFVYRILSIQCKKKNGEGVSSFTPLQQRGLKHSLPSSHSPTSHPQTQSIRTPTSDGFFFSLFPLPIKRLGFTSFYFPPFISHSEKVCVYN